MLITVGLFVLMLACLPLALRLDSAVDGDRPMYLDMERMKVMQTIYIATGESPVETKLGDGESVMIGKKEFTVSEGVTLAVRATQKDAFCITAHNQEGARSERCSE